jgi:hypothetical protein
MKKNKTLILVIAIIIILGLSVGILLKNSNNKDQVATNITPQEKSINNIQPTDNVPTATRAPTPTFIPVGTVVKSVTADKIIIENLSIKNSTFTIPKSLAGIKFFFKSGGKTIPAKYEDIKVGQKVTLKIIVPGKEAELYIEQ